MSEKRPPKAKEAAIEIAGAIARVTAGAAGTLFTSQFVGPILNELVSFVIPNQRLDRLQRYAQALGKRLEYIEKDRLQSRLDDPEIIDIFEDSCFQAARALTDDRIEQIASVVATGLSAEELKTAETKRMLWLLGQLVDQEVIILRGEFIEACDPHIPDEEFLTRHHSLLSKNGIHSDSTRAERDEEAVKSSYKKHLRDLGLTMNRIEGRTPKAPIRFDPITGISAETEITPLGIMLLRYLNLIPKRNEKSRRSGG